MNILTGLDYACTIYSRYNRLHSTHLLHKRQIRRCGINRLTLIKVIKIIRAQLDITTHFRKSIPYFMAESRRDSHGHNHHDVAYSNRYRNDFSTILQTGCYEKDVIHSIP